MSASANCVSVYNNTLISVSCESDVMSTACFLKDLVFSKVNVKVLGDTVDIAGGTNSASCLDIYIH